MRSASISSATSSQSATAAKGVAVAVSETCRLLCDLESRLEESLVLHDLSDILASHFERNFDAYIKYCSNQVYQDRTLRRLKTGSPSFLQCIARLESDRLCQVFVQRLILRAWTCVPS